MADQAQTALLQQWAEAGKIAEWNGRRWTNLMMSALPKLRGMEGVSKLLISLYSSTSRVVGGLGVGHVRAAGCRGEIGTQVATPDAA
jgi:hypothetical protein